VTTVAELRDLVAAGEGQAVEFKAAVPPPSRARDLAQDLAAFANSSGGRLLLGIAESRHSGEHPTFVGVDRHRALHAIAHAARLVEPQPLIETDVLQVEGLDIVIADVQPSPDAPHLCNGIAYVRHEDFISRATPAELRHLVAISVADRAPAAIGHGQLRTLLDEALRGPADAIARQATIIEELHAASGWKRQLAWVLVGAILGAVLGAVATVLLG
jgi:hypothetical protein